MNLFLWFIISFVTAFEFYSKVLLSSKKRNRYYKKDNEGLYYIPEVIN